MFWDTLDRLEWAIAAIGGTIIVWQAIDPKTRWRNRYRWLRKRSKGAPLPKTWDTKSEARTNLRKLLEQMRDLKTPCQSRQYDMVWELDGGDAETGDGVWIHPKPSAIGQWENLTIQTAEQLEPILRRLVDDDWIIKDGT